MHFFLDAIGVVAAACRMGLQLWNPRAPTARSGGRCKYFPAQRGLILIGLRSIIYTTNANLELVRFRLVVLFVLLVTYQKRGSAITLTLGKAPKIRRELVLSISALVSRLLHVLRVLLALSPASSCYILFESVLGWAAYQQPTTTYR